MLDKLESSFSVGSCHKPPKSQRKKLNRDLQQESSIPLNNTDFLLGGFNQCQSAPGSGVVDKLHSLSLNDEGGSETKSCYSDRDSNCSNLFDDSKSLATSFDTFSVISSDSYDSEKESSVYYSSISHCIKRRKYEHSDSIYELPDSTDQLLNSDSTSGLHKDNLKPLELQQRYCKKQLCFIFLLLLLVVVFSLTSVLFTCKIENIEPFNLKSIERNLSDCLIGQDFSRIAMIEALANFNLNDPNKVHLLWLVGPVGVGKSYTKHLVKTSIGSQVQVFSILSNLLPQSVGHIKEEVETLIQSLDICKPNLIWIDGFDEEDSALLFLNLFSKQLNLARTTVFHHTSVRVCIVLAGTRMSEYITQSYIQHTATGQSRQIFDYNQLRQNLTEASPFTNQILFFNMVVIPFLPLEISHIENCVIQQLNYLWRRKSRCVQKSSLPLEKFVRAQNLTLKGIQDEVLKIIYHGPVDGSISSEIVLSGCKRIYRIVTSLWFQIPDSELVDSKK